MSEGLDCIIIGAGAAGLAAGALLHEAGKEFLILEARDRIGGRAHSVALSDGSVIERGAQNLHGARVPTWEYVIRHGQVTHHSLGSTRITIPEFRDGEWWPDGHPETEAALRGLAEAFDLPDSGQVSLTEALDRAGYSGFAREVADSRMRVMTSADPRRVSASAAAAAWKLVAPTTANFMLVAGYRALWEAIGRPFAERIRLDTPVTAVEWGAGGVVVQAGDARYEATTAIVTLPVGVLQSGAVTFSPPLPARKQAAIDGLLMGPLIKLVAAFRRPFWEDQLGEIVSMRAAGYPFSTVAVYFWGRPGPPALVTFLGADRAEEFSGDPARIEAEFVAMLQDMFPEVDIQAELAHLEIADWPADPWARGAVSVEPVHGAHLRADLAEPTPPLFWAGEGTATDGGAECVHGALTTGRRAAVEAMHLLRPARVNDPASRVDWRHYEN